ncbi:MAG: TolC family protein [Acidobacteriia bacterium]|nr:TolC family protein [Terriglobia bacterium]
MRTRNRGSRNSLLVALAMGLVALLLPATRAAGGPPSELPTEYVPGTTPAATVSLLDAVSLALQHDPTIRQAQQVTLQQKGSLRQSAGVFDVAGIVQPSIQLSTTFLYSGQRKSQEEMRDLRRQIANESDRVADGLQQQLSQGNTLPPDCASEGSILSDAIITTEIGRQTICIDARMRAELQVWQNLAKNFSIVNFGQDLDQAMQERTKTIMDLLHGLAFAMREQLRALGTVPDTDNVTTFSLNLGLRDPFRNGAVLSPAVIMTAVNDNFGGKPPNPNYGGKGVLDKVTTDIGFEFDMPLGQGSGTVSADAPEKSAKLQYQASQESQAFTVSSSVLRTELAYWVLVGAQDTLALLEHSQQTEEKLLEMGKALVEGDQIAPNDLVYLKARVAATRGSVAQARQGVLQARINLASAMGLAVQKLDDTPLASDPFPSLPDLDAIEALKNAELADTAIANRNDLASSRRVFESANVLAAAARADLKRQITLTFVAGYGGLQQGGYLAYSAKGQPELHQNRYITHWGDFWSSSWNALSDFRAGPSAALSINISWPFKNNVALGRYAQARSLALSSEIQTDDLKRVISANTTRLVGSLRKAAREISEAQAAADFYQKSLEAQTEKFRLGESTAVDILLTEDNQLSQLLTLVSARQTFATLLTRLRFEAGTLVRCRIDNDKVHLDDLRPVGLEFPRWSAK